MSKIYYKVNFEEKELAKVYNLKWDAQQKHWFEYSYIVNIDALCRKFDIIRIVSNVLVKKDIDEIIKTHNTNRLLCYCIECKNYFDRKLSHKVSEGHWDHEKCTEIIKHYQCKVCYKKLQKEEKTKRKEHEHRMKTDKAYAQDCEGRNRSVNELGHE